jgi:hypothetical protein
MLYTPALAILIYVLNGLDEPDIDTPLVMSVVFSDIERGIFATGFVCVVVS